MTVEPKNKTFPSLCLIHMSTMLILLDGPPPPRPTPTSVPTKAMWSSQAHLSGGGVWVSCLPPEFTWNYTPAGHRQHTGESTHTPTPTSVYSTLNNISDFILSVLWNPHCIWGSRCFVYQVVDGFFVKRVQDVRESVAYLTIMTRHLTRLYQVKRQFGSFRVQEFCLINY